MSSFSSSVNEGKNIRPPTIRSVLHGLDLVPNQIDTSNSVTNVVGSDSCFQLNSKNGCCGISPSALFFMGDNSPFIKEEFDVAPMHGGSPSLGSTAALLASSICQTAAIPEAATNISALSVTPYKEEYSIPKNDPQLNFPFMNSECLLNDSRSDSLHKAQFNPCPNPFFEYNQSFHSQNQPGTFSSMHLENSRNNRSFNQAQTFSTIVDINECHKATCETSTPELLMAEFNMAGEVFPNLCFPVLPTPTIQKILSDPSLNRTARMRGHFDSPLYLDCVNNDFANSNYSFRGKSLMEDVNPIQKKIRCNTDPEYSNDTSYILSKETCILSSTLPPASKASADGISLVNPIGKPPAPRRTRSCSRNLTVKGFRKLEDTDSGLKSIDSDASFECFPSAGKNKRRGTKTTRAANAKCLQRGDTGDSRDSDVDPNLWIRVNLGERCTAAECTLRNPETQLAVRRHYHATCEHTHHTGPKAGMRFHHHQLEKIRKHQRAHLRKAQNAEGSGFPFVIPADVQDALLKAGAECHDPKLWTPALSDKLRQLVDQQHQLTGGGKVSWSTVADNLIASKLPGASAISAAQCMLHWRKVINGNATIQGVGTWCEAEDLRLRALVQHFKQAWSSVAKFMPGREAKQCRERYNNIIDPSINRHSTWTAEEDEYLYQLSDECRNSLSEITKRLPGHSYNDVKNRLCQLQKSYKTVSVGGKRPNTRLSTVTNDIPTASSIGAKADILFSSVNNRNQFYYSNNNESGMLLPSPIRNSYNDQYSPFSADAVAASMFSRMTSEMDISTEYSSLSEGFQASMPPTVSTQSHISPLGVVPEWREYGNNGYFMGSNDDENNPWLS